MTAAGAAAVPVVPHAQLRWALLFGNFVTGCGIMVGARHAQRPGAVAADLDRPGRTAVRHRRGGGVLRRATARRLGLGLRPEEAPRPLAPRLCGRPRPLRSDAELRRAAAAARRHHARRGGVHAAGRRRDRLHVAARAPRPGHRLHLPRLVARLGARPADGQLDRRDLRLALRLLGHRRALARGRGLGLRRHALGRPPGGDLAGRLEGRLRHTRA